jgi:hypothetical protein
MAFTACIAVATVGLCACAETDTRFVRSKVAMVIKIARREGSPSTVTLQPSGGFGHCPGY